MITTNINSGLSRNKAIDLIKLIALVTMVIDHLRFVFPSVQQELIAVGRWAFISFCFVIAINTYSAIQKGKKATLKKYFLNLVLFSFISEIPYRLMVKNTDGIFNIMPTLLLGFLFIVVLNLQAKRVINLLLFSVITAIAFSLQDHLQYGLAGALLIVAFYGLVQSNNSLERFAFIAISLVLALLCNLQYFIPIIKVLGFFNGYTLPLTISTMLAVFAVIGLFSLKPNSIECYVPKIGKWAYWFYPLHMLVIFLVVKLWC